LDARLLPQGAVGVFSGLQRLQELTLEGEAAVSLGVPQGLPPSVAKLMLFLDMQEPFSIRTVPALAQLSALQTLEVCATYAGSIPADWQPGVKPASISADVLLGMAHPEQLQVLDLEGSMRSNAVCTLMSVLPRLTNLLHMRVCMHDCGEDDVPEHVRDLGRYSVLLPPGPHLTRFTLTASRAWMLSAGRGAHMFGAGRQLPQLKVLELGPHASASHEPIEYVAYFSGAAHGGLGTPAVCLDHGDVESAWCAAALPLSSCGCLGLCRLVWM
jgi:hypothetical protein